MIKLLNSLYILLLLWAGFGVYEKYDKVNQKEEAVKSSIVRFKNKINRLKKEQKEIQSYKKNIDSKKKQIELVAKQIEKIQKRLPSEIQDSENIKFIREVSDSLKIRKVNIAPGMEKSEGFFISKRYAFTGEGTYLQFLLLLEKLAESERILDVKDIRLERKAVKKKGRYEIVSLSAGIESFKHNSSHQEDTGIRGIEDSFKNKKPKRKPRKRRRKAKK